jgi:streptogramin lyase
VDRYLGRVAADGRVTLHRAGRLFPGEVAAGPDGALWFIDVNLNAVGRMGLDGQVAVFSRGFGRDSALWDISGGPDGNLWLTDQAPARILRLTTSGQVTQMARLPANSNPAEITTGPDGNLWFTYVDGVGRITPQGAVRLTRLPRDNDNSGSITTGPDGNIWVSNIDPTALLRVSPDGMATRVPVGTLVFEVTAGPDGNLWFWFAGGVGRVAPDGSGRVIWREPFGTAGPGGIAFDAEGTLWGTAFEEFSIERLAFRPSAPSPLEAFLPRVGPLKRAHTLVAGVDGAMWMATRGAIVRIDASGSHTAFRRGPARRAQDLLPVRGGAVWFTFGGRGIARLSPDGEVRRFSRGFPAGSRPDALALGPDRNVWFIDAARDAVGRMTPGGRVREFTRGLGRRRDLLTIIRGPDRRLWVTDQRGAIDAISTSGRVRRFTRGLGRQATPTAIAVGPDGNLWFTEFSRRRIGRITPTGRVSSWRTRELPASIAAGPDRALWFTTAANELDNTTAGVGRITVRGRVDEFFVRATSTTGYKALAAGPDGKVWFLEDRGPIAVARMDPRRLVELGALPGS